jgi:hypothetical protein
MSNKGMRHEGRQIHQKHHGHEPWRAGWRERHVGMASPIISKALPHRCHSISRAVQRGQNTEAICVRASDATLGLIPCWAGPIVKSRERCGASVTSISAGTMDTSHGGLDGISGMLVWHVKASAQCCHSGAATLPE